jgi:hypothetical protein
MNRRTFDAVLATGGLVIAAVLLVAGVLGLWAHSFANSNVRSQLAQQQVFFPTTAGIKAEHNADITKYVTPYAGQQLVTGPQAEVYADHYIANHLKEVAGGQTYAQVSGKFITMKPTDPGYATIAQEREVLFQGETLRGLLLNAYAFWKLGQIAGIAAIVSFVGAGLMLLLSGLGFLHLRRTPNDQMLFAGSGASVAGVHEAL